MSRRSIRLSWVNFIRERKGKMEPKRILAELFALGIAEERRITKTFADERKRARAELRELKKANRAFADSVRSSQLYEESDEPEALPVEARIQHGGVSGMELKEPEQCGACGNKIYGAGISKDGDVVHPCCR